MNAREKVQAEKAAGLFDQNFWEEAYYQYKLRLIEKGIETDWLFQPLRNTTSSKHYLRMEGGTKELRYGIDVNYQGNYYTSSTYNELILEQKKIGVYEIPKDNYISFSSYQMYENYLNHRKD